MFLRAEQVTKAMGGHPVLRDVSFDVAQGDIVSIIGPSGVGKTTLLTLIAGLETPDSGQLIFSDPPDRDNPAILVFQDYLLFPNLTVFENVAFGLKARKVRKAETKTRVTAMLDQFGLTDRADVYPAALSAGQKQRVAIARAMVVNPALLLLDEPFANLDQNLKLSTAEFIRDTQKRFGVTTIVVTHDQNEAFFMSDAVGVMLDGQLAQFAPAREVWSDPATLSVARFLGPVNELPPQLAHTLGVHARNGDYYVRPENLRIALDPDGPGEVTTSQFLGQTSRLTVRLFDTSLTVHTTDAAFTVGDRVAVTTTHNQKRHAL